MRLSLFAAFAILLPCTPALAQSQAQADPDTECAATFQMLEDSARANGISNGNFGVMAIMSEQAHMARNPSEDPARYSLSVITMAQSLQQALNTGTLDFSQIQRQTAACNARYQPASPPAPGAVR